jgi:hypothetical protein
LGLSVTAEIILDDQSNYHPTKPIKKQTTNANQLKAQKGKKKSNKKHQKQYNFIF